MSSNTGVVPTRAAAMARIAAVRPADYARGRLQSLHAKPLFDQSEHTEHTEQIEDP